MSRFSGPQGSHAKHHGNKGVLRLHREMAREAAEERQANVKPENTRQHRRNQAAELAAVMASTFVEAEKAKRTEAQAEKHRKQKNKRKNLK